VEDTTKKLLSQSPLVIVGALLLIVGSIGHWPFSNPPLPITDSLVKWLIIALGVALILFGLLSLRRSQRGEVDERQISRIKEELEVKRDTLSAQQALAEEMKVYRDNRREQVEQELDSIKRELDAKSADLEQIKEQYVAILLNGRLWADFLREKGQQLLEEYEEAYWETIRTLSQEGRIDINLMSKGHDAEDPLVKGLYIQLINTHQLKGLLDLPLAVRVQL